MTTMPRFVTLLSAAVLFAFAGRAHAADEAAKGAPLRILLSEVQSSGPGGQQYCMLVFEDHQFHAEHARRKMGKDVERKVFLGQVSDAEWKSLVGIIDAKDFRGLNVRPGPPPIVVSDPHPYAISVARDDGFQSMEFLTRDAMKPYDPQLKPLLQWWKALREQHLTESQSPADSRCALTNSAAVVAN
jgi:hypothetical protein